MSLLAVSIGTTMGCGSAKGDGAPNEQAQTERADNGGAARILFSGRAEALRVRGLLTADLADTGPLPPLGGELDKVVATADLPGLLHADALHAQVTGADAGSRAQAELARVVIGIRAIEADVLKASATAECNGPLPTVRGESFIASLKINGEPIVIDNTPNQVVDVPGIARVVINEQARTVEGTHGAMTVSALHATLLNSQEIFVSYAEADVQCGGSGSAGAPGYEGGGGGIK